MKQVLQILFLLFTWFTNLNATPIFTKVAFPSYEFSISKTDNINEEGVVKIGVQNFARSEITKNELQTIHSKTGSSFKTLLANNEKGNFSAPTFEKDLSKSQYSSLNFSKKEQLSLLENRAREELVILLMGRGKFLMML